MSNCVICTQRNRKQHKAYNATATGKAKNVLRNARPEIKEAKERWKNSEAGQSYTKQYARTPAYAERGKKFAASAAGKAIRKRTYEKHWLSTNLMNGLARILRSGTSHKTMQCIAFDTEDDVRAHFVQQGLVLQEYGSSWTVDHKIPKSEYNHNDPEDVLRCWSAGNMCGLPPKQNKEKWVRLIRDVVDTVPVPCWPKAWGGILPAACV